MVTTKKTSMLKKVAKIISKSDTLVSAFTKTLNYWLASHESCIRELDPTQMSHALSNVIRGRWF